MHAPCLQAEQVRAACAHLHAFEWQPAWPVPEKPIAAAVLVPLIARDGALSVLLTRRTEHLRHHAGQISFPGGRADPEDHSPIDTALRETQEEVGILRDQVEVLGALPVFPVVSGFVITPVIGLIEAPLSLNLDAFEVAEAFELPFAYLMQAHNYQLHRIVSPQGTRQVHAIAHRGRFIWGATAGILAMLSEFMIFAANAAKN